MNAADGAKVLDRFMWPKLVHMHCLRTCKDPSKSDQGQRTYYERLLAAAHSWERQAKTRKRLELYSVDITMRARTFLKTETGVGSDGVASEMILGLPVEAVYAFHTAFKQRFPSGGADISAWHHFVAIFLQTYSGATDLEDYRGNMLLAVVLKWYIGCLGLLSEYYQPAYILQSMCILGFCEAQSVLHLSTPMCMALAKSFEWPNRFPMAVFCGDVWRAFDYLSPEISSMCAARRGTPAQLNAALFREGLGCKLEPIFPFTWGTPTVNFNRCAGTGSTDAPRTWNWVIADALRELQSTWAEKRWAEDQWLALYPRRLVRQPLFDERPAGKFT